MEGRELGVRQGGVVLDLLHLVALGQEFVEVAGPARGVVAGPIAPDLAQLSTDSLSAKLKRPPRGAF